MGKVPLNMAADATVADRVGGDHGGVHGNDALDGAGNHNKISGFHKSVKSKNYQVSSTKPTSGHPGPNKKGVGATSYTKGAVQTALNISTKGRIGG